MIAKVIRLIKFNWRAIVIFEILYKLTAALLAIPLLNLSLNMVMKLSGYKYITKYNLIKFLKNPKTIIYLCILLIVIGFYALIDIIGNIYIFDFSRRNEKTNAVSAFKFAFLKSFRMFIPTNIGIVFIVAIMFPFMNIGITSGLFQTISLPYVLKVYVVSIPYYRWILISCLVVFAYLTLRWMYSFHFFTLEKLNFFKAGYRSARFSKKNKFVDLIRMLAIQGIIYVMFFVVISFGVLIVVVLKKFFKGYYLARAVFSAMLVIVIILLAVIFVALATPIGYATIATMYYTRKEERGEEIEDIVDNGAIKFNFSKAALRRLYAGFLLVIIFLLGGLSYYINGYLRGDFTLNISHVRTMEITSHRGASNIYPENTMIAFEKAIGYGAKWIELDVHLSKDGQVFVMHDESFKRTTGVKKKAWELTYDEILELDAGSYMNKKYEGEQIPLLVDVIKLAKKNKVKLNIEIKASSNEKGLEEKVVDIVNENDFAKKCVITSQNYNSLKKIKNYDENIKTIYVMSVALGNIATLKYADGFSLNILFVNGAMVKKIHNMGKEVYVWTVNDEKGINDMIDAGVDNIITDNVSLARSVVNKSKTSNVVRDIFDYLSGYVLIERSSSIYG
ncbi:glycerophosphoryl diester phosphodiesterase [Lachnospiraceae bacterium RM5]|nr:glycerophosphoryl diester phosphodiesterase [Lachnospiraceae bacterium RM5]